MVSEAQKLINSILANPRLTQSRVFAGKSYDDEPILRTGSDLRQGMPEIYTKMRNLGRPVYDGSDYKRPSETKLFVQQAKFMAAWEDDVPYGGNFKRYFPTYSMMNDRQLRGYFTWRAEVRKGNVQEASLSYAFVYAYELLNCVGDGPQQCFDAMLSFWTSYKQFAPDFDRYMKAWMRDFVIYHALDAKLLGRFIDLSFEESLIFLRHAEHAAVSNGSLSMSEAQLRSFWAMLVRLSTYRLNGSKFALEHREEFLAVIQVVFTKLACHYAKSRKKGITSSWFGSSQVSEHEMFQAAVFYEPNKHKDMRYDVNEVHSYACENGRWFALRRYKKTKPNEELGVLLHEVDRLLRVELGWEPSLQEVVLPKYQQRIISEAISAFTAHRQSLERRRVVIDRSVLQGIRESSAGTREQLLIDEERQGTGFVEEAVGGTSDMTVAAEPLAARSFCQNQQKPEFHVEAPSETVADDSVQARAKDTLMGTLPVASATPSQGSEFLLDAPEMDFLSSLLQGASITDSADADLLVDSINEKLFDLLGDSAIEFGENGPQVIQDYRKELEGVVSI